MQELFIPVGAGGRRHLRTVQVLDVVIFVIITPVIAVIYAAIATVAFALSPASARVGEEQTSRRSSSFERSSNHLESASVPNGTILSPLKQRYLLGPHWTKRLGAWSRN